MSLPRARGLNHITLAVADLDRAWALWVDVLGAQPLMRSPRSAYLLVGELWLCLVLQPHRRAPDPTDYTHLALTVAPEDLVELRARALAAGCTEFQPNTTEGASAYLRCADGHQIELHVGDWRSRLAALRGAGDPSVRIFDSPPTTEDGLSIVILAVSDPARSRDFYAAVLGCTVRVDAGVFVQLALPGGPDLGLYARPGFAVNTGRPSAPTPAGHTSAAELYVTVAGALDDAVDRATTAGATVLSAAQDRAWGDRVAYLADPDGHVLALAQPLRTSGA